jgi:hypothetical protein
MLLLVAGFLACTFGEDVENPTPRETFEAKLLSSVCLVVGVCLVAASHCSIARDANNKVPATVVPPANTIHPVCVMGFCALQEEANRRKNLDQSLVNKQQRNDAMGYEPPRRSLAAVTGLHPAAPSRACGGG